MKVGSPRLLVAVFSLAILPQTVACSPMWFLASAAEMLVTPVELEANIAAEALGL
jgi:hypothetical protein